MLLSEQPKVEYYRGLLKLCLRHRQLERVLARLDEQLKIADEASRPEDARGAGPRE